MTLREKWKIDATWTLFLDRDGVINIEKHKDYIRNRNEFIFYEDVAQNFSRLNQLFGLIVVVTNQRGIGKGLMTHDDLQDIHNYLSAALMHHGGHIHHYFYAPDLDSDSENRKPNIGMGMQAKALFPQIDFEKSIMVGNNMSDMEFGSRLGMKTVFVETTTTLPNDSDWVDECLPNFAEFIRLV